MAALVKFGKSFFCTLASLLEGISDNELSDSISILALLSQLLGLRDMHLFLVRSISRNLASVHESTLDQVDVLAIRVLCQDVQADVLLVEFFSSLSEENRHFFHCLRQEIGAQHVGNVNLISSDECLNSALHVSNSQKVSSSQESLALREEDLTLMVHYLS